jgi:hypothetical protein
MRNRGTVVLDSPYTQNHDSTHDQPAVVGKDGRLESSWDKVQPYVDDYDPVKNPYATDPYWSTHQPWVKLMIVSGHTSKTFGYNDLTKILNS